MSENLLASHSRARSVICVMYAHIGGFESTHIFGTGQDVLGSTKHIEHWEGDLQRLLNQGITKLRYSAPWHRIERTSGAYDWSWFDQPMEFMHAHNMVPILDPLHHTSFPDWLKDGMLHPHFPELYVRFIGELCNRYPWATHYTVFNEPLPTTLFCSYTGMWYPHLASDRHFVSMLLQVGRAICSACEHIQERIPAQFIHVDTCEHHKPLDSRSASWSSFCNSRRFLVTDLILGRISNGHPMYRYLTDNGASERDLAYFGDHPVRIDVLALDYYLHSEMDWFWSAETGRMELAGSVRQPRGFASIAHDYLERYRVPIMLGETNIVGTVRERIAWLKLMEAECEELVVAGVPFRGFCWYPSVDTTDWSNACTRFTGKIDPQGIWSLREGTMERIDTALSDTYGRLARGEITARQIPDYAFGPDLANRTRGYRQPAAQRSKIA